ncbi:butyrophilin subfamily 1 member A1-like isoform X1 [Centrocercus urophasianus]|uniref:butyrophilin subfamily 1 member A1-like isoform X1 n=1 Tax=Centrocercus urophasianus TaxID=9002 RepID=UPI001C6455EE|nr:butyrophilin subfamily 1 member A1-like isoform X1 [Centrocercus urophasianus]
MEEVQKEMGVPAVRSHSAVAFPVPCPPPSLAEKGLHGWVGFVKTMFSGCCLHCPMLAAVIYSAVFHVHELQSAPFSVQGPPDPVAVAVGQDVVLPCRLSPEQSTQDMEVTWFRDQFTPFVHRYRDGQDQYGDQELRYQGRTEMRLANGSVSLRILRVQLSDRGSYTCFVRTDLGYDEAAVELQVTASGSAPLIALQRYQDGGIRVACRSAGWFPQPQLLWRDPRGQWLPSLSENVTQDGGGLYTAESVLVLASGDSQELACVVRAALHNQEKESAFSVADPFFQNARPWKIALSLVLVAVVALSIVAVYLLKMKGKHEKKIAAQAAELRDRDSKIEKQAEELVWRRYAAPIEDAKVVLDAGTAHCDLILADDGRSVKRTDRRQDVPSRPERFDPWRCVLGCEGFTAGRHCWEVEVVLDGGGWTVGVCREDVRRKGEIEFGPEEGIWAVGQWAGQFQALTSPQRTLLPDVRTPTWVRIALDYELGRVAFFSLDEEIPIFTFPPASFHGIKVHPWLWLGPGTQLKMWP